MSIQEIMKLQTATDEEMKMSLLLAIHCAPILLGVKAANIVTVTGREFFRIGYMLQETDIRYRFLKTKGEYGILYLYREKELLEYLYSNAISDFLEGYGYQTGDLNSMLECLSARIGLYIDGKISFPHEIGVFLEYPLMDVKGFLEHNGEDFVYSGYWKVYHDVQNTIHRFQEYDQVREYAVMEIIAGKKIRDIAV